MSTQGLMGAVIGAILGAAIWAGISYATNYELGIVAWAVGGLVGGGAAMMGGRGSSMGVACAALALVAILVGKVAAVHFSLEGELKKIAAELFTRAWHTELKEDAAQFATVESRDQYAQYMIERRYAEGETAEDVSAQAIADFERDTVPELREMHRTPLGYSAWYEKRSEEFVTKAKTDISVLDAVTDDLGLMDILFAGLGLVTAFRLGEGLGGGGGGAGTRRRPQARSRIQGGPPPLDPDGPDGPGGDDDAPPARGHAPVRRPRR